MDARVLGKDRAAEENSAQRVVARPERPRLDRRSGAGGNPDADERPPVCEHVDAVDEVLPTDRVDDDVDAARVRQLVDAVDEARGPVVDAVVQSKLLQPFQLLVTGGGRDYRRAGALGE